MNQNSIAARLIASLTLAVCATACQPNESHSPLPTSSLQSSATAIVSAAQPTRLATTAPATSVMRPQIPRGGESLNVTTLGIEPGQTYGLYLALPNELERLVPWAQATSDPTGRISATITMPHLLHWVGESIRVFWSGSSGTTEVGTFRYQGTAVSPGACEAIPIARQVPVRPQHYLVLEARVDSSRRELVLTGTGVAPFSRALNDGEWLLRAGVMVEYGSGPFVSIPVQAGQIDSSGRLTARAALPSDTDLAGRCVNFRAAISPNGMPGDPDIMVAWFDYP